MKLKKSLVTSLFLLAALNTNAQISEDTSKVVRNKKTFILPTKVIIPPAIASDPRYKNMVAHINSDYNFWITKDLSPLGITGETKIEFGNSLNLNYNEITEPNPFWN